MIETVLSVDIGTTSLKAGLITADGEVVSSSAYHFKNPDDRFIARQWFYALKIAVSKLICRSEQSILIKAVAVSGNGPTLVLKNGLTFRWNEEVSDESNTKIDTKSLFLPRILELEKNYKEEFDNSSIIFSGPEFLIYKLTGKVITILPEERFITAYWTQNELSAAEIPSKKIPPFINTGDKCGYVSEYALNYLEFPKYLKFTDKIPVFAGGPDFIVALIGTNTLTPGKLCDRSGSSEGLNFCIPVPVFDSGLRSLPSVIPGLWNISALLPNSSKIPSEEKIEILQIYINHLKKIAENNNFEFPSYMTATGGQTRDKSLMKLKSEKLNMDFYTTNCDDAELLGDAIVAFTGLNKNTTLQENAERMVKINKVL